MINKLIAEEFLGWIVKKEMGIYLYSLPNRKSEVSELRNFQPETNPTDWIRVLRELEKRELEYSINYDSQNKEYDVGIYNPELKTHSCYDPEDDQIGYGSDKEIGVAICKAVLDMIRINID